MDCCFPHLHPKDINCHPETSGFFFPTLHAVFYPMASLRPPFFGKLRYCLLQGAFPDSCFLPSGILRSKPQGSHSQPGSLETICSPGHTPDQPTQNVYSCNHICVLRTRLQKKKKKKKRTRLQVCVTSNIYQVLTASDRLTKLGESPR